MGFRFIPVLRVWPIWSLRELRGVHRVEHILNPFYTCKTESEARFCFQCDMTNNFQSQGIKLDLSSSS